MKYHKDWLIEQIHRGTRQKYLFFWGHQPSVDGKITHSCFSQWWEGHPFEVGGTSFLTAEHWMMAEKAHLFGDEEMREKIIHSSSPGEAKQLGRKVRDFDSKVWEKHRSTIVEEGNYHKFSQHVELQAYLLTTGNRIIVEASPVDAIWGIGLDKHHDSASQPEAWKGLNLLGFALMEVRDQLREITR